MAIDNSKGAAAPPAPAGSGAPPVDLRPDIARGDPSALGRVLTAGFPDLALEAPPPGAQPPIGDPNAPPPPGAAGAPPAKSDLQKSQATPAEPGPEPEWSADQAAWFELRAKATPEEIEAVDGQAPAFSDEQRQWLERKAAADDALASRAQAAGRSPEDQAAFETGQAGAKPKSYTEAEVQGIVKDRVDKLQKENEQLRQQLNTAPIAPPTDNSLAHVTTVEQLDQEAQAAQGGLDYTTRLLNRLARNARGVEQELRELAGKNPAMKARFVDADGREDFSPERMGDVLEEFQADFQGKVKAAPNRRVYLQVEGDVAGKMNRAFPWYGKAEDPRQAMFNDMIRRLPGIKAIPTWAYWVACGIERHLEIAAAAQQGRPGGGRARKAPPVLPRTASRGYVPAPPTANGAIAAAKDALKKNPTDEKALAKVFEAAGYRG